jgi:hypothetical protein
MILIREDREGPRKVVAVAAVVPVVAEPQDMVGLVMMVQLALPAQVDQEVIPPVS